MVVSKEEGTDGMVVAKEKGMVAVVVASLAAASPVEEEAGEEVAWQL